MRSVSGSLFSTVIRLTHGSVRTSSCRRAISILNRFRPAYFDVADGEARVGASLLIEPHAEQDGQRTERGVARDAQHALDLNAILVAADARDVDRPEEPWMGGVETAHTLLPLTSASAI